jgi:signal transduction histidine kinase/ligand-binding sensor domain-containing protein/DNA-binding response OmpR family regulator
MQCFLCLKKPYVLAMLVFQALFLSSIHVKVFSQTFPYQFKYLTVDEGLSHTDANDIAQDRNGYIWVGTFFGLDRFDGYTIKKYYNVNVPLQNAFKNRVRCLYPDKDGMIWLGTENGVQCFDSKTEKYIDFEQDSGESKIIFSKIFKISTNRICGLVGGKFKVYQIKGTKLVNQKIHSPSNLQVTGIAKDSDDQLYLSSNHGLWTLNAEGKFSVVPVNNFPNRSLNGVFVDKGGDLLLVERNQLIKIGAVLAERTSTPVKSYQLKKSYRFQDGTEIRDIVPGRTDYWVNTGNELIRLDKDFKYLQTVNNSSSHSTLNSNSLNKLLIDRSECLWVCTFGGGVNYCDLNQKLFFTLQHNYKAQNSLSGNHIRSILETGKELWIGTTANGLNLYDLKTNKFSYYNSYNSTIRIRDDAVTALTTDRNGNLWIGTNKGLSVLRSDRRALLDIKGSEKFPATAIEALAMDFYGNIWFGNHADRFGVIWKDRHDVYQVTYYQKGEGYYIWADKDQPRVFISSNYGLKQIEVDTQGGIVKMKIYRASKKANSLSSDYTYPVTRQNDHTYWIGTIGGGVNRLKLGPGSRYGIKTYNGQFGVQHDVESVEIDDTGKIWMGGNGLQCLDPVSGRVFQYDKNDGLQGNSFKVGASYKGAGGRLYFGGINGLNYFYPGQIRANRISAEPRFTDIKINNKILNYGDSGLPDEDIGQTIGYKKELRLSQRQNNFTIFFAAMHFANPLKCRYRYKLIGFDEEWQYTDGRNPSASYSNLDFSDYRFVMQASNNDGVWSRSEAEISIIVFPPWWKSDLAKSIYCAMFIATILAIYFFQHKWHRMKTQMEISAAEEKKRQEISQQQYEFYQQQLTFFTNVSHEFRTPLTLILGPLESLIRENKNPELVHSYQLMFRNAKRLINLVSELMNFRKVADSVVKLQVQPLVITDFFKDIAWEFQDLAESKSIRFNFTDHTREECQQPLIGFFDVQIVEKILFNLLNNSFKYTSHGGEVSFDLFFNLDEFKASFDSGFELLNDGPRAKQYLYFRVLDTGIGISAESITQIFDRYYRISKNHLGSGVGLALVKSLTQLHKGDIYVYSERHKGTEIIIGLPLGEENYVLHEKALTGTELQMQLEAVDKSVLLPVIEKETPPSFQRGKKRILIVEDNQELRSFLRQTLEKFYSVAEAAEGYSAIDVAVDLVPDLIISDVMMPGINGIELCKLIKERFETRHIPFMILSAKDSLDTKLEGMESGADYYFAKPLSIDLLLVTVRNIFEQGTKLKLKYTNDYLSEATELVHSEKDKIFFQRLLDVIENNIRDPALDVDFLCKHLFISRTKLYQKIKSTSDQSVGEFIRSIRLKKAVQIMTHEDVAINEVVDRIGFQSSSNFSRAFRKEYGKSPLQFVQGLKKQDHKPRL